MHRGGGEGGGAGMWGRGVGWSGRRKGGGEAGGAAMGRARHSSPGPCWARANAQYGRPRTHVDVQPAPCCHPPLSMHGCRCLASVRDAGRQRDCGSSHQQQRHLPQQDGVLAGQVQAAQGQEVHNAAHCAPPNGAGHLRGGAGRRAGRAATPKVASTTNPTLWAAPVRRGGRQLLLSPPIACKTLPPYPS